MLTNYIQVMLFNGNKIDTHTHYQRNIHQQWHIEIYLHVYWYIVKIYTWYIVLISMNINIILISDKVYWCNFDLTVSSLKHVVYNNTDDKILYQSILFSLFCHSVHQSCMPWWYMTRTSMYQSCPDDVCPYITFINHVLVMFDQILHLSIMSCWCLSIYYIYQSCPADVWPDITFINHVLMMSDYILHLSIMSWWCRTRYYIYQSCPADVWSDITFINHVLMMSDQILHLSIMSWCRTI